MRSRTTGRVLGRRHTTSDADVQQVMEQIEVLVPREALEQLSEATLDAMRRITKGHQTAFAWSGGKDSLVLAHLLERASVPLIGVLGITEGLEYPAMDEWYRQNTPPEITIHRAPYDLAWLATHQHYIFTMSPPYPKALTGFWAEQVWLKPQQRYCEQHGKDMLILGRRRLDGNSCGPAGSPDLYSSKGVIRYLPIMDWSQEEVLAYLHYYHLSLPPIYSYFNGFKAGGHPWPARQCILDVEDGWAQVYACDPTIVEQAAPVISAARDYLENPSPIKSRNMHVWAGRILKA